MYQAQWDQTGDPTGHWSMGMPLSLKVQTYIGNFSLFACEKPSNKIVHTCVESINQDYENAMCLESINQKYENAM